MSQSSTGETRKPTYNEQCTALTGLTIQQLVWRRCSAYGSFGFGHNGLQTVVKSPLSTGWQVTRAQRIQALMDELETDMRQTRLDPVTGELVEAKPREVSF